MSVRVMSLCYDARFGSANRKAVAVALADHADDKGANVYPSVARLAFKTELSERTVQRALRELEQIGIIVMDVAGGEKGLPKSTNEWHFDLTLLRNIADGNCEIVEAETGDTESPMGSRPVSLTTRWVSGATPTGVSVTPEPSINHQEPSRVRASEGSARATPATEKYRRLVLKGDHDWQAWLDFVSLLDPKAAATMEREGAMVAYAKRPNQWCDRPKLAPRSSTHVYQDLLEERLRFLAEPGPDGLTERSKAMSGEAA